jgi:hypothetical protein
MWRVERIHEMDPCNDPNYLTQLTGMQCLCLSGKLTTNSTCCALSFKGLEGNESQRRYMFYMALSSKADSLTVSSTPSIEYPILPSDR